jgi:glutaredoxin
MCPTDQPNALLLVSSHCPHCHMLETLLQERLSNGVLGELSVINIEQSPDVAQKKGVRSVPWLQLGNFLFDEALTPIDLDRWIEHAKEGDGQANFIAYLLERGKLVKAIEWIDQGNTTLEAVVPLLVDTDAKINVRVGVGAILEHFEDTQSIRAIISDLISLLKNENPVVRTDACHYLSLTHSRDAIEPLRAMLEDEDQQVREVASESIEELSKYP